MVKRNILLNPGPGTTTDTVKQALVVPDICPRERDFGEVALEVERKLVRVVEGGESYTAVMLAGSGTAAMEAALISALGPEDKILIVDNGAYGRRARQIAEIHGLPHVAYELAWGDSPDIEAARRILERDGNVTHFFLVHHETTTGMLNPLPEFLELGREFGLISIVDAISSYAGLPIDLRAMPVDYLLSSANKCIQGMAGLSFVISRKDSLAKTKDYPKRSLYLDLYHADRHLRGTGQFPFTPPVQVMYALRQALDEFFAEGQEARTRRYVRCYEELMKGLAETGLECLLPARQHSKLLTAVLEPQVPGYSFMDFHDHCYRRGVTIYPGKAAKKDTFRVANIGAIDYRDMRVFNGLMKEYFGRIL
ncbi:MAG: 2-aminoethylphosphonate--pyruvate transaminase [Candidatus Aminicenantes bacterium]|nr:2-aminoethylphosphonate--pyruvate transaminase [Candidatus Aminicenantes bacterium]